MGHFTYFPTGQFFVSYFALRCTSWFRCFSWLVGGYCGSLQPRLMLLQLLLLSIDRQSSYFSTNAFFGKISSIQPRFISIKLNLFVFVLRIYSIQAFFFLSCFFVNHSFAIIYFHLSYFLRVHFFYSTKKKQTDRFGLETENDHINRFCCCCCHRDEQQYCCIIVGYLVVSTPFSFSVFILLFYNSC